MPNRIDEMTEREAKDILNDICHHFSIGGSARGKRTIMTNVRNSIRRSNCLSSIEREFMVKEEGCEYSLLNWGESPDKYIETFRKVMKA